MNKFPIFIKTEEEHLSLDPLFAKNEYFSNSKTIWSMISEAKDFLTDAITNGRLFHFIFQVFRFLITLIAVVAPSPGLFATFAIVVIPIHSISTINTLSTLGIYPTTLLSFKDTVEGKIQEMITSIKECLGMETTRDESGGGGNEIEGEMGENKKKKEDEEKEDEEKEEEKDNSGGAIDKENPIHDHVLSSKSSHEHNL